MNKQFHNLKEEEIGKLKIEKFRETEKLLNEAL